MRLFHTYGAIVAFAITRLALASDIGLDDNAISSPEYVHASDQDESFAAPYDALDGLNAPQTSSEDESSLSAESLAEAIVFTPASEEESLESIPSLEARQAKDHWAKVAQEKGRKWLEQSKATQVHDLTKAVGSVNIARQPKSCSAITGSIIDSCKKGVRTQVAFCKQALRDTIAQCKNDVKSSIDKCKKKAKWPWQKPKCEANRGPGMAKCEGKRVDIPFCEVDRLTASCCEGLRPQASSMCRAGLSTAAIQKQVQSAQATCQVATGIAKAAMKSYLSGQALGILTQLESIKAIGDTINVIRKAEQTRSQFDKWAGGLEAAAQGRMKDAEKALGSLISQISPSIGDAIAWADAAQALVTKNVDEFVAKAAKAAGELQAIKSAKDSIKGLKGVANDINAIRTAAKKCAALPKAVNPNDYPGWKNVKSEADVNAAVEAYKKKVTEPLRAAAQCQAVVTRVQRILK